MIVKFYDRVWYGDKPSVAEAAGQIKSVINVAHSIRKPYWQNVGKLDWNVWYFRMPLPDRMEATDEYCRALEAVVEAIEFGDKFPVLCHCRMGGHRGPTAALFVAWKLCKKGEMSLNELMARMSVVYPGFFRPNERRVYRWTMLDYMKRNSS